MKNVHKIRGKREFLFDDRELFVLGSGAIIICALIFILGFLVGQGVEQNTLAETLVPEESLASAEFESDPGVVSEMPEGEQELASEEEVPEGSDPTFGYYRVLPDNEAEFVQVEATPVKEATPEPAEEEASSENPETAAPEAREAEQEPTPEPDGQAPAAGQQETVASTLPNVPKSPTDEMHVGRPATSGLDEGIGLSEEGLVYSVQVSSSPNPADSEHLQQKFIALGFQAYVKRADLREKGIWYRVWVGKAVTKEEAELLRQEILNRASHLVSDPYIVKAQ